jgi:hypothetical protein
MYFLYNEYRIFKPVETTIRRGLKKKENRAAEPIWVIIHIYVYIYIYIYIHIYGNVTMKFPV